MNIEVGVGTFSEKGLHIAHIIIVTFKIMDKKVFFS